MVVNIWSHIVIHDVVCRHCRAIGMVVGGLSRSLVVKMCRVLPWEVRD